MSPDPSQFAPRRPLALTLASIVGFSFGLLGVCCMPFGVYGLLSQDSNPAFAMLGDTTILRTWSWVSMAVGVPATLLLLIGSAGVYGLHGWGRACVYVYAALATLSGLGGMVVNLLTFGPFLSGLGNSGSLDPMQAGMIGGLVGGTCGGCFGLLLPVAYVVVLMLPSSREAFEAAAADVA